MEQGVCAFTLRLVSELDGVDELLLDGSLETLELVAARPEERRFAVLNDGMLELAFLSLDTLDEPDAPRLGVTVFLGGEAQAHQLEAHCFLDGTRFAEASLVSNPYAFTANDGTVVGGEFTFTFDDVRGWNALSGSGWGSGWHLLEPASGLYEVKVVRESRVTRVVSFTVHAGRIVVPDAASEVDPGVGSVLCVRASVAGELGGPGSQRMDTARQRPDASASDAIPFYGCSPAGGRWGSGDALFLLQPEVDSSGGAGGGSSSEPGVALDEETEAALQAFIDRVERLVNTWEDDFGSCKPPFDSSQVLAAEAVLRERPGADALSEAATDVPDERPVDVNGSPTTVGRLRARLQALFDAAEGRIMNAAQQERDELAPFRALLKAEKLAIFDDHPADEFVYTTSGRRIIETPEQLASAEWWYFEGPLDQPGTGTVDGVQVKVSVQGWRVIGWRFDDEGRIVDRVEVQGQGASAPMSAYP